MTMTEWEEDFCGEKQHNVRSREKNNHNAKHD